MAVNGQDAAATKGGGRTTPDKLNRVDFNWHIVRTLPHQENKLAAMLGEHVALVFQVQQCPVIVVAAKVHAATLSAVAAVRPAVWLVFRAAQVH